MPLVVDGIAAIVRSSGGSARRSTVGFTLSGLAEPTVDGG
jgi:hypothetical protein